MTGIDTSALRSTFSVSLDPDPRISTLRPGWLADDEQWRDQLQAMERDDARWFERQWEMAGGAGPAVDTSWITWGETDRPIGPLVIHLVGAVLLVGLLVAAVVAGCQS